MKIKDVLEFWIFFSFYHFQIFVQRQHCCVLSPSNLQSAGRRVLASAPDFKYLLMDGSRRNKTFMPAASQNVFQLTSASSALALCAMCNSVEATLNSPPHTLKNWPPMLFCSRKIVHIQVFCYILGANANKNSQFGHLFTACMCVSCPD